MTLPYEVTSGATPFDIYDTSNLVIYLLNEDGSYILLETNGRIELEIRRRSDGMYEITSGPGYGLIYEED